MSHWALFVFACIGYWLGFLIFGGEHVSAIDMSAGTGMGLLLAHFGKAPP